MEQLKVTSWARPVWFWDELGADWSLGSVVEIVPPMAGMIVPETAIINHGGEPLGLTVLCGVWGQDFEWRRERNEAPGTSGLMGQPGSLGCDAQPFARPWRGQSFVKAWRRPRVLSSDPKTRRSRGRGRGEAGFVAEAARRDGSVGMWLPRRPWQRERPRFQFGSFSPPLSPQVTSSRRLTDPSVLRCDFSGVGDLDRKGACPLSGLF